MSLLGQFDATMAAQLITVISVPTKAAVTVIVIKYFLDLL